MLYLLGLALSIFTTSVQGNVFAKITGTEPPKTPSLVEVKTVGGDAITPTVDVADPATGEIWTLNAKGETVKFRKIKSWVSVDKKSTATELVKRHFQPVTVASKKNGK